MNSTLERISEEDAKDALLRSGYLLEHRLENTLRAEGYYVETNAAYSDPETGKSRELDLYALTGRRAGPEEADYIFPVLLIECVNNPQPIAFITKEPQVAYFHRDEIKLAGLPIKIQSKDQPNVWTTLPAYLGMEKYHHYCRGRIATQFCSFIEKKKDNKKEWMATHDEVQFDALRKLSAETEHFVRKHFESWEYRGREYINIEFYYPLLVVQGELLEIRPSTGSLRIKKAKHIQFRRSAIVGGKETTYQIDVVTEHFFPKYVDLVDKEISKTARLMRRRHTPIRKSINRISTKARRLRSPQKIRSVMGG
jgi:hypothetical protein